MKDIAVMSFALAVMCGLCLWGWGRQLRRRRIMSDTPTSKTQGVFIGEVEVKGTAEVVEPRTSFLPGAECVHYERSVEEEWSRWVPRLTRTTKETRGHGRSGRAVRRRWRAAAR